MGVDVTGAAEVGGAVVTGGAAVVGGAVVATGGLETGRSVAGVGTSVKITSPVGAWVAVVAGAGLVDRVAE